MHHLCGGLRFILMFNSIYLSIYPYLSIYLSTSIYLYPSIYLSFYLYLSIYLSIFLSKGRGGTAASDLVELARVLVLRARVRVEHVERRRLRVALLRPHGRGPGS